MGKIGLAVTPPIRNWSTPPSKPDAEERGFYRSQDKGESWEATQLLHLRWHRPPLLPGDRGLPQDPDLVYQMDVFVQVTRDGGAPSTTSAPGAEKHSDNHALWIDPQNGNHLLVGTDAGLYETFDEGVTWRHFPNLPDLPVLQASRWTTPSPSTTSSVGPRTSAPCTGRPGRRTSKGCATGTGTCPWAPTDTTSPSIPTDPNILYFETQQGNLVPPRPPQRRGARTSSLSRLPAIRRSGGTGTPPSSSARIPPSRLYFGSQRVWRSDDRRRLVDAGQRRPDNRTATATRWSSWAGSGASMRSTTTVPCRSTPPSRPSPSRRFAKG